MPEYFLTDGMEIVDHRSMTEEEARDADRHIREATGGAMFWLRVDIDEGDELGPAPLAAPAGPGGPRRPQ